MINFLPPYISQMHPCFMPEGKLGYPVCSGWFEEFGIWANDWLRGEWGYIDEEEGKFVQHEDFNMKPMCNYHQGGVYLSREYWVAMVEMFGYSIEEGVVLTDPDAVEPELTTLHLNTRDIHEGSFSDTNIMTIVAKSKGIEIKSDL